MATLKDLDDLMQYMARSSEAMTLDQFRVACISELKKRHPGEKIYIPAPDQSKKQMIITLARQLPTGVVATRLGVTPRYVREMVQRGVKKRN